MSIGDGLLLDVALVAAVLLVGLLVVLLRRARAGRRRARESILAAAEKAVMDGLRAAGATTEARERLAALSRPARERVLLRAAAGRTGEQRRWLRRLARELGVTDRGRRLVRSRFWWRRLRGARLLEVAGGPDDVLPLADDPHPRVRSQVAAWARAFPSDGAVAAVIGLLGDPSQPTRFAAQDALVRIGEPAVDALADALGRTRDPFAARAGLMAARGLADGRLTVPVLRLADHPSPEVRAAARRTLSHHPPDASRVGTGTES